MEKQTKYHHSITENGNIQVRLVTEYRDDEGNVLGIKCSEPMTPTDTSDMGGWDDRSRDIVAVITDKRVMTDFATEKQKLTGIGVEKIVTYDRVLDDDSRIAIRQIIRIFDDGKEVSKKYHRSWILPGDATDNADVISKAVAKKIHTADVIMAYKARIASIQL